MMLKKLLNPFRKQSPDNPFEDFLSLTQRKINDGRAGKLRLTPKELWLNISENCNLRCVGCYTEGRFKKVYADIEEVRKAIQVHGTVEQISFTTNEAMLHPQFCDIIDLCRETHPSARLWIITNGTIPIKGRYRNAISKLNKVGLSIDGATKETYESIRHGANFDDFLKNTKDIISIRDETGSPEEITFGFTATATNLHELKDVVKLAHDLGVNNVWAQAMEAKGEIIEARIADILISNLEPSIRIRMIEEAKQVATELGIGFYYSEGLYPFSEKQADTNSDTAALKVRMCQYPWTQPAQITRHDGQYLVRPCCYIPITKTDKLAKVHGMVFPEIPSADEVYNSPQMWNFREKLLKGEAMDVCGSCQAAAGFQPKL